MESILLYFIKSGALLVMFLSAYSFFLRKETFFKSNRWFLLFGLVISVLLPVVTFKKTIWVEPTTIVQNMSDLASEASPVSTHNLNNAATESIVTSGVEKSIEIDWFWVIASIYTIGILALLVKFALDFYALKKVLKGQKIHQQEDYKFVNVKENIAPFSYFNYIVYNPALYNQVELENILEHEKVHCSQNHTIDVLIARVFCIAFWWNPFVWLYKKAIVQNLEFIADSNAFKNISDKKAYQFTLLKITTHDSCVAISNHFYQSLIKKRIVMLNKNQSNRWNSWKYAIIVPALVLFMWQFQTKVVAQEKARNVFITPDGNTVSATTKEIIEMSWNKDTSDEEFENDAKAMKREGVVMKFSKIKRNKKGEIIALKISYKDNLGNEQVKQLSSSTPIEPIVFIRELDQNGNGKVGFQENINYSVGSSMQNGNDSISVIKNGEEISYNSSNSAIAPPTPPMPPMPPALPNYPMPPSAPNFPTPPTPPTTPPMESNKKAWKKFEENIKKFETKMNSAEMKKWEKEIEEYGKKMDAMSPDTEAFDNEMKVFDEKMQTFDAEMSVFEKEMQEFNRQIQQEIKTEMLDERNMVIKDREAAKKEREQERSKAKKEREKALKK
jgi:beta-lactamase regulating signal transducer with metallopeptidase domain